jgi:hypothetical protein
MIPISIGNLAKLVELAIKGFDLKQSEHRRMFTDHIDPCFNTLLVIHNDYLAGLDAFERKVGDTLEFEGLRNLIREHSRPNEAARRVRGAVCERLDRRQIP